MDAIIQKTGSRVRELNLLKTLVLIELNRVPEAYNLTNAMVSIFADWMEDMCICCCLIVFFSHLFFSYQF